MSVPRPIRTVAFYLLVTGIVLESVFPFYYAVITSFK
jgi:ABC-type glycerol-3-phosphate transport system permease component